MQLYSDFIDADRQGPKISVGVVGDAMIDEFMDVDIKKISPEFPIIVLQSEEEKYQYLPGGAANCAYQFTHFNADAHLYAFSDDHASKVFLQNNLNLSGVVEIGNQIPRKRRLYSQGLPVSRTDIESKSYGFSKDILHLRSADVFKNLKNNTGLEALILSDYNKGLFAGFDQEIIREFKNVIVDPKCGDLNRWRGCTVFKPNLEEALRLSGKSTILEAGAYLLDLLSCQAVVVTMAGDGVMVFQQTKNPIHIRAQRKLPTAESVIGAGDCFAAFYAMSLVRGFNYEQAAEISFHAGTLYVQNKHNTPLSPKQFKSSYDPFSLKFVDNPEVFFDKRNYKLVFTNGCFDFGLTSGHVECINFAKNQGDKLVVALNSDDSVKRLKGNGRPILPFADRVKIISSLQSVDYVIGFDEDTPLKIIQQIVPDLIVKGGDYTIDQVVGNHLAQVKIFDFVNSISTTQKIEKMNHLA